MRSTSSLRQPLWWTSNAGRISFPRSSSSLTWRSRSVSAAWVSLVGPDPKSPCPSTTPLLSACIDDTMHAWDVYTDGSWYTTKGSADTLLGKTGTHTGGCVPIFATTNSPVQVGVVILLMDARDLSLVDGGGPRMMELTMVTAGIILLHQLSKRGHVNTDHQGLVSQLTDSGRIRCTGLMSGSPLVLSACEILQFSQISLHLHRGQPERRGKNAPYGLRKTGGPHLPPRGPAPPSPRSLFPSSLTWRPSTNSLALANVDPSMTSMMTMY